MIDRLRDRILESGARIVMSNFSRQNNEIKTTARTISEIDFEVI